MFRCIIILTVFVLAVVPGWAVEPYTPVQPDPVLEPWRWQLPSELRDLGLLAIAEGPDGSMWFGTDEGLRYYDGVDWTLYTLADGLYGASVHALCPLPDGRLYVGTERGISLFEDGTLRRVFPTSGDLALGVEEIIHARDGSIWAGTRWGALHLSANDTTFYTSNEIGRVLREMVPDHITIVPKDIGPIYAREAGIGIQMRGGVIWSIAEKGPGQAAGLAIGDRILSVNGVAKGTQDQLNSPPGTSVELTVQRSSRADSFNVSLTCARVEGQAVLQIRG